MKNHLSFTKKEENIIKRLKTPAKVQDYLNSISFNFENGGETLKSPLRLMREKSAHCMEGALFACYVLSCHNIQAYLLHLQAEKPDYDHVVCVFKMGGLYGAISKTNHAVLRYREPVYKSVRELVMSYFHEYFLNNSGCKTLRKYSALLDLHKYDLKGWVDSTEDLWYLDRALDKIKHYSIAPYKTLQNLRPADKIEIKAGSIVEWK